MTEKRKIWHWIALAALSIIWGTSYILMKKGLESFSSLQIGCLRVIITFICLLPVAVKNLNKLSRDNIMSIIIVGLLGSVFPAVLFPLAETRISSSLAGMLNSLSPVFVVVIGIMVYKRKAIRAEITGIILGLIGAVGLLHTGSLTFNLWGLLVILAAGMSGFSSNEVSKVKGLNGIQITALSFFLTSPLAIISIMFTDLAAPLHTLNWIRNLGFISILSIVGSAIALTIYYPLIRNTSPVFGSSVSYFIPIVATIWGFSLNEHFYSSMIVSVLFIFAGVFLINRPDFFKKRQVVR
jgi:drug/metabolite transporter (DMT)-like permease